MNRGTDRLAAVLALGLSLWGRIDISAAEPEPDQARIKAIVSTLASAEYAGRRGAGGRKAADYLVAEFRRLGLKPLFDGSFEQVIPGRDDDPPMGRNVGALIRGDDPNLRDEWVVISAHFDHLGTRNGVVYPGADDNASGVAMMLETARCFAESKTKPRRSLMFVGFDLEEMGLFGSRYFVEHCPAPLSKISLFVTADMIGRALGGVCASHVFVMGTEHAPGLRPWVDAAARDRPITVGLLGSDLLILDRSDYGPFRSRKVPYLFFSTGENPLYHTPGDSAETLDYPKATAISRLIYGICRRAAVSEQVPTWTVAPDSSLREAETIRDVLKVLLAHREALKIGSANGVVMANTLRTLDDIVGRGAMTAEERVRVARVTKWILFSLFSGA